MKTVNFKLLYELSREVGGDDAIATTISILSLDDIPMSDVVIQLGIVLGVLQPGYHHGWIKELQEKI